MMISYRTKTPINLTVGTFSLKKPDETSIVILNIAGFQQMFLLWGGGGGGQIP
jgi:hypothetical protein